VLFASSLFFAGISAKLQSPLATLVTFVLSAVVFLAGLVWIATMPMST
jgi:hypothetical protein